MSSFLRKFSFVLLLCAVVAGILGLQYRFREEMAKKDVALLMEYSDAEIMARQTGLGFEDMLDRLLEKGISAISFKDLTGADLRDGDSPFLWGTLRDILPQERFNGLSGKAALFIPLEYDDWFFRKYLHARFPDCKVYDAPGGRVYVLPGEPKEFLEVGVVPDPEAMKRLARLDVPLVYRPSPTFGIASENVASSLDLLFASLWRLRGVLPQGTVVFGYPDTHAVVEVMRRYDALLLQPEFVRQIGGNTLSWQSFPNILPLHSVTTQEVITRNISRPVLVERFARAARERSVRVLLLRPYDIASAPWIDSFEEDLLSLKGLLQRDGFEIKLGEPYGSWQRNMWSVIAFLAANLLVFALLTSMAEERFKSKGFFLKAAAVVVALALGANYASFLARIMGAMLAAFGASVATVAALEDKKPFYGLLKGMALVLAVGLALSSFFGTPHYMLRLLTFSGVKATLALPPIFVLLYDMTKRRYPESPIDVLKRPPLWGELLLLLFLLAAAAVLLIRSGNVSFVPKWEVALRDAFERYLVARPRNKEIFVGYPALWLALLIGVMKSKYSLTRFGHQIHLLFRMASSLAFASAVNSFCHFHTRIYFICWRVFNGLWVGSLFGLIAIGVFLLALRIKAFRRLFFGGEGI